jgi:chemotaxis-related protein WspB
MLLLTFRTGESLYAVEGRQVVEVIPRVGLRPIPHAPPHLLGLLSYRGQVVPVVDFGAVVGGSPGRPSLNTRIILVEFPAGPGSRRIGVVAENVTEVVRGEKGTLVVPDMSLADAPYLGPVYRFEDRLIQVVKPGRLLDGTMQAALYGGSTEAG